VRDFVLSLHENLRPLQRAFAIALINSQEEWEHISGDHWLPGKELDWYCSSGGLQWHMSSSVTDQPLVSDADACSWIQHSDPLISSQALTAFSSASVVKLTEDLIQQRKFKQAATTCLRVLSWGVFPDSIKLECAHTCIDTVQKINNLDDQDYMALGRACFFLVMNEKDAKKRKQIFPPLEGLYRSSYMNKLPILQQV
jgi:hypothetical protein